jgi:DNA-binding MarR family transcriptional regulator
MIPETNVGLDVVFYLVMASRALPAQVWELLMRAAIAQFGRTSSGLAELGLTPGHMKALLSLDADEAAPMGTLASRFACDASTMTWLVDRLEERGLVERRAMPGDRRVKAVALTKTGQAMKRDLERRLFEPPAAIHVLPEDVLIELRDVLSSAAQRSGG